MRKLSTSFLFGFVLALICLPRLHAQTGPGAPAGSKATATDAAPAGQAPDDVMKKLSDLVHAGKYAEAQQLTAGLLLAYPEDQRLIKAKVLLDKSLASSNTADLAASADARQLTGMDKVEYNTLIELAREAQQGTGLEQQRASLNQFMDKSRSFLQKHPDQILLWQLRAASAISLNDPMAACEAGQKLIATGAADSNDPNMQRLLAQLNSKGWLDKHEAGDAAKRAKWEWILGTWTIHYTWFDERGGGTGSGIGTEDFTKSGDSIEGYLTDSNGVRAQRFNISGLILDSGEVRWPPVSFEPSDNDKTLKIVFTVPNGKKGKQTVTWLLHKE